MKRFSVVLATCVTLLVVVLGSAAFAQEDSLLERYDIAVGNLDAAMSNAATDGVAALEQLDLASNALLTLDPTDQDPNLVSAMVALFDQAREAVENQSPTDMTVQTSVLRGSFARLVMNRVYDTVGEDFELAQGRLAHLAASVGVAEDRVEQIAGAPDDRALLLTFEAAVASAAAARAEAAAQRLPEEHGAAYEALASAYGTSLLIQDSPRASPELNMHLVTAANLLVDGRYEEATTELTEAAASLTEQDRQAAAAAAQAPSAEAPEAAATEAPSGDTPEAAAVVAEPEAAAVQPEAPGTTTEPAQAAEAAPAQGEAAEAAVPAEGDGSQAGSATEAPAVAADAGNAAQPADASPVEEAGAVAVTEPAAEQAPAPDEPESTAPGAEAEAPAPATAEAAGEPAAGATSASEPAPPTTDDTAPAAPVTLGALPATASPDSSPAVDAVAAELTRAGLTSVMARAEAAQFVASGYDSVDAALTELEASAARAVSAQRLGDAAGTRDAIASFRSTYQGALAGALRLSDGEVASETDELLASLPGRHALGGHEVTLLASQAGVIRNALNGAEQPAKQRLELAVDAFWSGLTKDLILVITALLAIMPLILLRMAFGGANRNWRMIGWALFLLLLPIYYEGVLALANLITAYVDVPWLASLAGWSVFNTSTLLGVWALLSLIAVLLATLGLYGICIQFGLLDSRKVATSKDAAPGPANADETGVDWEESY